MVIFCWIKPKSKSDIWAQSNKKAMLDARLMSKPRIRHCFQTYSHLRLSTFLVLSNCIYPSEQCRVESNCRKHKVLPQLKAASFEQMSFHMHIAGTSVMWSIFKAQYINQYSNLIAIFLIWYIWLFLGWSGQKLCVWFILLCPNNPIKTTLLYKVPSKSTGKNLLQTYTALPVEFITNYFFKVFEPWHRGNLLLKLQFLVL